VEQCVLIFLCTEGYLDRCPPIDICIDAAMAAVVTLLRGEPGGGWWAGGGRTRDDKTFAAAAGGSSAPIAGRSSAQAAEAYQHQLDVIARTHTLVLGSFNASDPHAKRIFLAELLPEIWRLASHDIESLFERILEDGKKQTLSN
jgi:hypothetical protein